MSTSVFPDLSGGGGGGGGSLSFPLVAPDPGASGSEPFAFASGGGLHGTSAGGLALSTAAGDVLGITSQGAASFGFALGVAGLATLAGGATTTVFNANTVTTTGNTSIGGSLGVAGSIQATGDLAARNVTASAGVSAASLTSTGSIAGASISVTGMATIGSLTVRGTFRADQIESDGALLFPTSSASQPGVGLADQSTTGIFAAVGSLGFSVAGQSVLTFAANRTASFPGNVSLPQLTATSIGTGDLQATGSVSLQAVTATSLTTSGATSIGQNLTVAGDLTATGVTRLGNLRIDQLSTDHNLSIGGDATVNGATHLLGSLLVDHAATFSQGISVTGTTALGTTSANRTTVGSFYMLGGAPDYVPVRRDPVPGQPTTTDYVVTLDPGGELAISGALFTGKGAHITGSAAIDGGVTTASLTTSGNGTVGGSLAVTQGIAAMASVIGGSAFSTGQGLPGGTVSGSVGDLYVDRQGGLLYLKTSGTNTTAGWVAVSTSASSLHFPLQAPASTPTSGPSYAFATSSGDGFGSTGAGNVYLATGNTQALGIDASQKVTLGGALQANAIAAASASITGALSVQGQTTLASTTTGALTSGAISATTGSFSGNINAPAATFNNLTTNQDASIGGMLTTGTDVAASRNLLGTKLIVGNAAVSTGNLEPNGNISGTLGDLFIDRADGELWLKISGNGTNTGWSRVSTSATGTAFPLTAPDGTLASPSYGFAQGSLGFTATGTQQLSAIINGVAGWTLDSARKMTLAGALQVAGSTTLAALTAASATISNALNAGSLATSGTLSAGGTSTLGLVNTGFLTAASVTSQAGVSAATAVTVAGTAITPGSAKPSDSTGAQGDLAPTTAGGVPLYVRGASAWKAVAFVGDAAPTNFPLRGPADSASAPNYASSASPGTGMFAPAANQLGFATNGTQAGYIDASQNWVLAGALSAQAGTLASLTVNGALSATGNTTVGGTLSVTGAVTLSSSLTSGAITSSGKVTATSAAINGLLSTQTANTTGDVTIGGSLTVNGTTNYAGIQRSGYLQTGDGTVSSPAYAFTAEPATGLWRPGSNTLAIAANSANVVTFAPTVATFAGAIRVGNANVGILSPAANTLALQTAGVTAATIAPTGITAFGFQTQHVGGSGSAPGVSVGGSTTGLFAGTDNANRAILGVTQGGVAMARFASFVNNSTAVYLIGLGDPASASTSGGIVASAQLPTTGAPLALPGMLYQDTRGGTAPLWVNESTTSTPSFARVLTTSSPGSGTPSFPIVGPAGTAAAPTFQAGSTHGMYSTASALGLAYNGVSAALLTSALASLPGALQVGGTNAGLTSSAANSVSLQANGNVGLTVASTGVVTFGSSAQFSNGTAAAPSIGVGSTANGIYGDNINTTQVPAVAQGGLPVASFITGTINSNPSWVMRLGAPGNFASTQGGIFASISVPTGNLTAPGGTIYQQLNGGAGTSLWVNEASSGTSNTAWAKVLTTSSTVSVTFPILAPSGTAAAPSYSFSASSGSGVFYAVDAGAGNVPAPAISAGGKVAAYFTQSTINSLPSYNFCLGDPSVNASPYNGIIRSSQQAASGNITAAPGQLAINPSGGAGTILSVKETGVGTTSGWSFLYTQGTAQIAGQNGTSAAPYISFAGDKTSGLYYGDMPYFAQGGKQAIGFSSNIAGMGYSGFTFGAGNTDGNPYMFALPSSVGSAGNPNTLAIPAGRAALMLNGAGAAGNQLWLHEPGSSSSGWARVLTESTALSFSRLLQTTAPTTASGQAMVWADTANQVRVSIFGVNASSAPFLKQEIVGTLYGASQGLTLANSGTTICVNGSTQYTLTLPGTSSTSDTFYRFQVEGTAGVVIKANTGQLIYLGTSVSTSGGTLTSSAAPGNTIELYNRAGTNNWFSRGPAGSWSVA